MDQNYTINHRLEASGLVCPEPVMLLHKTVRGASLGECIEVVATDPSTKRDIPNFCRFLGHDLLCEKEEGGRFIFHIRKGR